mmetsp:Transcript_19307/g.49102  ORF Transcript_19307/g.49102 Transcript_19307/m.49102 type:complete len:371 (-) Transcript_19307:605-1717(-)
MPRRRAPLRGHAGLLPRQQQPPGGRPPPWGGGRREGGGEGELVGASGHQGSRGEVRPAGIADGVAYALAPFLRITASPGRAGHFHSRAVLGDPQLPPHRRQRSTANRPSTQRLIVVHLSRILTLLAAFQQSQRRPPRGPLQRRRRPLRARTGPGAQARGRRPRRRGGLLPPLAPAWELREHRRARAPRALGHHGVRGLAVRVEHRGHHHPAHPPPVGPLPLPGDHQVLGQGRDHLQIQGLVGVEVQGRHSALRSNDLGSRFQPKHPFLRHARHLVLQLPHHPPQNHTPHRLPKPIIRLPHLGLRGRHPVLLDVLQQRRAVARGGTPHQPGPPADGAADGRGAAAGVHEHADVLAQHGALAEPPGQRAEGR